MYTYLFICNLLLFIALFLFFEMLLSNRSLIPISLIPISLYHITKESKEAKELFSVISSYF